MGTDFRRDEDSEVPAVQEGLRWEAWRMLAKRDGMIPGMWPKLEALSPRFWQPKAAHLWQLQTSAFSPCVAVI